MNTPRLLLSTVTVNDADFILELLNTPGWLKFIGDRNVKTIEDASNYILKITGGPGTNYFLVKLRDQQIPVGVITFMKRDYLDHHDIGFAFHPDHAGKGYAYEAAKGVLDQLKKDPSHTYIKATVLKDNKRSIQLLERLGLTYEKELEVNERELLLYTIATDKFLIDDLTAHFFSIFTNLPPQKPDWEKIRQICLPQTLIIKKGDNGEDIYDLKTFIEPRREILSDGTLTSFEEKELISETRITGNIAQRFSKYNKSGYLNGEAFETNGHKLFQFVKTSAGWKINAVIWEDEKKLS
ncbi:hypothetical protein TH53_03405 [Pedobacter lusitanus]|uniref:N-acetyltransferase domain-containing protein n=1 Tax=Pedobacter lusitanus TaxID=1503925 RepID=A0A0D0F9Q9_9SPHI|nr:GNAT family N-acetyltransferase [Pedobacter lusitanus]KIO78498.1 hypothetical protein TH53_03405 [Pedobacter lusitanus]